MAKAILCLCLFFPCLFLGTTALVSELTNRVAWVAKYDAVQAGWQSYTPGSLNPLKFDTRPLRFVAGAEPGVVGSINLGNGPDGNRVIGFDAAYRFPAARAVSAGLDAYRMAQGPVNLATRSASFEVVFRAAVLPGFNEAAILFEVGGADTGVSIVLQNDGTVQANIDIGASQVVLSSSLVQTDEWHVASLSFDPITGTGALYLDGVLQQTDLSLGPVTEWSDGDPFGIGTVGGSGSAQMSSTAVDFIGLMMGVTSWSGEITEKETLSRWLGLFSLGNSVHFAADTNDVFASNEWNPVPGTEILRMGSIPLVFTSANPVVTSDLGYAPGGGLDAISSFSNAYEFPASRAQEFGFRSYIESQVGDLTKLSASFQIVFKPTALPAPGTYAVIFEIGGSDYGTVVALFPDGTVNALVEGNSRESRTASTSAVELDEWVVVALTCNLWTDETALFINGVEEDRQGVTLLPDGSIYDRVADLAWWNGADNMAIGSFSKYIPDGFGGVTNAVSLTGFVASLDTWTGIASPNQVLASFNAVFPPFPDIDVVGNSVSITSPDDTPSSIDGTEFGTVEKPTIVTKVFTIVNRGRADLSLTNIGISGSGDFDISQPPAVTALAPDQSTEFTVRLTATTTGDHTATITIISDDTNETPYTFDVHAYIPPAIGDPCTDNSHCNGANGDSCLGTICGNFQFQSPLFALIDDFNNPGTQVMGFSARLYLPVDILALSSMDVTMRYFIQKGAERLELTSSDVTPSVDFVYRFHGLVPNTFEFVVQTHSSTMPAFDNYEFIPGSVVLTVR